MKIQRIAGIESRRSKLGDDLLRMLVSLLTAVIDLSIDLVMNLSAVQEPQVEEVYYMLILELLWYPFGCKDRLQTYISLYWDL